MVRRKSMVPGKPVAGEKNKTGHIHIIILLLLGGFLSAGALFAQDPTTSESIHARQNLERHNIERRIEQATAPLPGFKVTSPQLPPPDIEGKSQEKIFKLNKAIFEPIPRGVPLAELEAVVARYAAMDKVSMYDLYCMVVEIDALFDERHVLGRAGLPVQDVENGIVTVEIIEGRESNRNITTHAPSYFGIGNASVPSRRLFGQHFVRHQFRFSDSSAFDIQELENEILRYNRTFSGQIFAGIEPGDEQGDFALNLTRNLPRLISGGYSVDNTGRKSSGSIRNSFHLNVSDALGANESFFISYDKTEGTSALHMQGKIPVSRFGTFFDMSYYYGEPKTISGSFAALLINGKSEQYRPGLRQILVNKKKHRLDATFNYQNYDSRTYFDTSLNYAEKHNAWTIGLEYEGQSSLFAGFSLTTGNAETLAIPDPDYKDTDFNLLKMNFMKVWVPGSSTTLVFRGNASVALSDLPQSQSFQIGGMATVRGAPEALVSGDTGYLYVAEYRRFVWSGSGRKSRLSASKAELLIFFDHGYVFDRDTSRHDFLHSIGFGGTIHISRHFSATGVYGKPIFTGEASDIYQDQLRKGSASFTFRVSI